MTGVAARIAKALIRAGQHSPFGGKANYGSSLCTDLKGSGSRFPQAEQEYGLSSDLFQLFPELDRSLVGRRVLDLGSGYGGRTVRYAELAQFAYGVEVYPNVVAQSTEFAASRSAANCEFRLGTQTSIPLSDESVDLVVSYDVLEHVQNPAVTLEEAFRVLRPGGLFFLAFTPYDGALAHHLGYITRLPAIHWFFGPHTIVAAVNAILTSPQGGRFGTAPQPEPHRAYDGKRWCLPSLNGLTSSAFWPLVTKFEVLKHGQVPILERYRVLGRLGVIGNDLVMRLSDSFRDRFSANLWCLLRKPA